MTNRGDDYGDDGGAGALVRGAGPTASRLVLLNLVKDFY